MTARIVVGYPDGRLANPTFRAYKRARRTMRTRGIDAVVELRPLGSLSGNVDLLVVEAPPPDGAVAADIRTILVVPADRAAAEIEREVDALVASGEIGHVPPPPRTIAVHRGVEPLTERARVADAT